MRRCQMTLVLLICSPFHVIVEGLTNDEIDMFTARTHVEETTGLQGTVSITTAKGVHTLKSNGIPDHTATSTRRNPNVITVQNYVYQFPRNPSVATESTNLNQGPIGFAINGIPFYNPYTNDGRDAVEAETFDECDGHPDGQGRYHYHKMPSTCLFVIEENVPSTIIGVARDGFAIYGPIDEHGNRLNKTLLDACHGKVGSDERYRYYVTDDFPYILGCYTGVKGTRLVQ